MARFLVCDPLESACDVRMPCSSRSRFSSGQALAVGAVDERAERKAEARASARDRPPRPGTEGVIEMGIRYPKTCMCVPSLLERRAVGASNELERCAMKLQVGCELHECRDRGVLIACI